MQFHRMIVALLAHPSRSKMVFTAVRLLNLNHNPVQSTLQEYKDLLKDLHCCNFV